VGRVIRQRPSPGADDTGKKEDLTNEHPQTTILAATAIILTSSIAAAAEQNSLENAGFFWVYLATCIDPNDPPPQEKLDMWRSVAQKDIERFGKEAVEKCARTILRPSTSRARSPFVAT
jgi:hypothetical protein